MEKILKKIKKLLEPKKVDHKGKEFSVFMLTILIIAIFFSVSYYNLPFLAQYWDYLVHPQNLKLYLSVFLILSGIALKIHYEQHKKQKKRFTFLKPKQKKKTKK